MKKKIMKLFKYIYLKLKNLAEKMLILFFSSSLLVLYINPFIEGYIEPYVSYISYFFIFIVSCLFDTGDAPSMQKKLKDFFITLVN